MAAPLPTRFICLGKEIVISNSAEIVSCRASAAKAFTVTDLLDVTQAACHALVAVTVERIEVQRHTGITAGVYFVAIKDRLHILVHDLRRSCAVGIDEVVTLIGLIIALGITVTQRKLDCGLVRLLAAELGNTLFDCSIRKKRRHFELLLCKTKFFFSPCSAADCCLTELTPFAGVIFTLAV